MPALRLWWVGFCGIWGWVPCLWRTHVRSARRTAHHSHLTAPCLRLRRYRQYTHTNTTTNDTTPHTQKSTHTRTHAPVQTGTNTEPNTCMLTALFESREITNTCSHPHTNPWTPRHAVFSNNTKYRAHTDTHIISLS